MPVEELIQACAPAIVQLMREEMSDESEPDRIWLLRQARKNYLYYKDLQNYAPQIFDGMLGLTAPGYNEGLDQDGGNGFYDYSSNIWRGYCLKFVSVLGTRMPNAIAVPDNPEDEQAIRATRAANNAALYILRAGNLEIRNLDLAFKMYTFGTPFYHIDWVVDGEKYGVTKRPKIEAQELPLGDAAFRCPNCGTNMPSEGDAPAVPPSCPNCQGPISMSDYHPPTMVSQPINGGFDEIENGGLEIEVHDVSEVSVPLDSTGVDDCAWLRWDREVHKSKCLKKWRAQIKAASDNQNSADTETVASEYAQNIRSAFSSPIGVVRSKRPNRWTVSDLWLTTAMYELLGGDDDPGQIRELMKQNFPDGVRITSVRGAIVDMVAEKLSDRWQEVIPAPSKTIMADPLGNDMTQAQDLKNDTLNNCVETIERNNLPALADPRNIDIDQWANLQSQPARVFPVLRPAGGSLDDVFKQMEPLQFSEQLIPFQQNVEGDARNNMGLQPSLYGGDGTDEPTARQAELKKNAALQQLGIPWKYICKATEQLYLKATRLLADHADGTISFANKNQFGQYESVSILVDDLKYGQYHFEADEAVPMTWGQKRDLLMWMLDKSPDLLKMWGFDHPLNVYEFKELLGMPGEYTPYLDDREKALETIAQLVKEAPAMTQNPDGSTAPAPSIPIDEYADNHAFCDQIAKAFLQSSTGRNLKTSNPNAYQNVSLWGQAHEKLANQPPAPTPPKATVALSLKGPDLGSPAVQAALQNADIVPPGVPVQQEAPLAPQQPMPPPGMIPQPAPAPQPAPQPGPAQQ